MRLIKYIAMGVGTGMAFDDRAISFGALLIGIAILWAIDELKLYLDR